MTEERFIEFEGAINVFELRKVMFDATDATDETTDRTVSMKLIICANCYIIAFIYGSPSDQMQPCIRSLPHTGHSSIGHSSILQVEGRCKSSNTQ